MSGFDDELRRAAADLAREPLPHTVLSDELDEPAPPTRWPAFVLAVAAGALLVAGAGLGIRQLASAPSASTPPSATSVASPTELPDETLTASTEELGIRLTVTLDRDRTSFGQRVWASATLENLGPGTVFYEVAGGCSWPLSITATTDSPWDPDLGRDDWTGDLDLLKGILVSRPTDPNRRLSFVPEVWVDSGPGVCLDSRLYQELPEGESVEQRAAWDADAFMGMPPAPGTYAVEASFLFTRGTPPEMSGPPTGDTVSVELPLNVAGEDVPLLSPGVAVDALLSDNGFVQLLAGLPSHRWTGSTMTFEGDRWIATLSVGTSAADPNPATKVTGVVDARTGAVLDVQLEQRSADPGG